MLFTAVTKLFFIYLSPHLFLRCWMLPRHLNLPFTMMPSLVHKASHSSMLQRTAEYNKGVLCTLYLKWLRDTLAHISVRFVTCVMLALLSAQSWWCPGLNSRGICGPLGPSQLWAHPKNPKQSKDIIIRMDKYHKHQLTSYLLAASRKKLKLENIAQHCLSPMNTFKPISHIVFDKNVQIIALVVQQQVTRLSGLIWLVQS